jgi:hypothetical protein
MSKLSRRMGELKSRGGRAPDQRTGTGGITHREPIGEDARWAMRPPSHPQPPSPFQNMLFLALAAVAIIVINAILWGGASSDAPEIDPATGRQINQGEPWN